MAQDHKSSSAQILSLPKGEGDAPAQANAAAASATASSTAAKTDAKAEASGQAAKASAPPSMPPPIPGQPTPASAAPPAAEAAPFSLESFAGRSSASPQPGTSGEPLKLPPPIPGASSQNADAKSDESGKSADPTAEVLADAPQRRSAKRRPAGPVRTKIAANDDAPSIGGLIFALEQRPSNKPFKYAALATAIWAVICGIFAWAILSAEFQAGNSLGDIIAKPTTFLTATAILAPAAILWFLALLAWRSEELRLRSSTMTEVAIRLAEPDRMAEQSVASLGQAVRRQVSFMNDAISRALGRAGELEALVHNEVSALERSYEENERKIRGLIQELSGERNALLDTSERVTVTLRTLGTDIPTLIDKLSNQQIKLAQIIQGAGDNLTALESAVGQSTIRLEETLGTKSAEMQGMLDSYTQGLAIALGARTDQLQDAISGYVQTLDTTITRRTETLQSVFEQYGRALDTSLASRAQSLDVQLVERTRALDEAFGRRLQAFDEAIMRSTLAIDGAVSDKARALTSALENHARTFSETIARQAVDLDESLMQGITSVRRTSENITRQSLKAIEGLAGQSEMLRNVSENLLAQINTVTNRFEGQGQAIMRAANSLESANFKIESTLQTRHAELSGTMERLSGKADEFGRFITGYSSTIEGSLSDAEQRARAAAEQLRQGTEATKQAAFAELERLKTETGTESERTLEELRRRFSSISSVVSDELVGLSSRIDQTSEDVRQKASRAAAEIAAEQNRLREQLERLPVATRESAEQMRRSLQDQLRAIEQLSHLTNRAVQNRDISPPMGQPGAPSSASSNLSLTSAYTTEARQPQPAADPASTSRALSSLALPPSPGADPRLGHRQPMPQQPMPQAGPQGAGPQGAGPRGEGWSLGDLLARASKDEEGMSPRPVGPNDRLPPTPATVPFQSQIATIARALDPATAAAIWARVNAGQRGVMARSIYSHDGRAAFDDLSERYRNDPSLRLTIDHYLQDFERIRREAEQRDPSGHAASSQLVSDMGRVYLFLAHVAGRIT